MKPFLFLASFAVLFCLCACTRTPPATATPDVPVAGQSWTNSLGVKFVPAGTDDVLFSIWDVRVKDYVTFLDANPGYNAGGWWYHSRIQPLGFTYPDFAQTPECPAVMVSWEDAHAFCAWLTKKEQGEGRLRPDQEYRLPTDAEWSKAVGLNENNEGTPKDKGGKIINVYPWGVQWPPPAGTGNFRGEESKSKYPNPIAGYNDGNVDTSPVGSFTANQYGLYDISGNVWQWCDDEWNLPYDFMVLRGGSFIENSPDGLLSSARHDSEAFDRTRVNGFRCVVAVSPQRHTGPVSGQSWTNSLGVKFVSAGTDNVLFSVWDVRVKDFKAFVDASGYDATADMYSFVIDGVRQLQGNTWKSPGFPQTDDCPVVGVSWYDAKAFCDWLTKKEQLEGRLRPNQTYRLPTDVEWSKAVGLDETSWGTPFDRDPSIRIQWPPPTAEGNVFPWGTQWPPPRGAGNYCGEDFSPDCGVKGYRDGFQYTSPVGSFPANQYGLYDMGGNVIQWCEDEYRPPGDSRVVRGASWDNAYFGGLLSSYRGNFLPDDRSEDRGFRCVVVLTSP